MNHEVQELINKANQIIQNSGSGAGAKYPKSLKQIVITLRNDYKMSIKEVIGLIPISSYSAREWPRLSVENKGFNQVKIERSYSKKSLPKKRTYKKNDDLNLIIFNQRVLIVLTTVLIFQPLVAQLFD